MHVIWKRNLSPNTSLGIVRREMRLEIGAWKFKTIQHAFSHTLSYFIILEWFVYIMMIFTGRKSVGLPGEKGKVFGWKGSNTGSTSEFGT